MTERRSTADGRDLYYSLDHLRAFQTVQGDGNGDIQADLTVTATWAPGNHTLAASDENNHTTKQGSLVQIVPQGADGTPGPYGAPTDSARFTLQVTALPVDPSGDALQPFQATLAVNTPSFRQRCNGIRKTEEQLFAVGYRRF